MKEIAGFQFPESGEDMAVWTPACRAKALSRTVLAVAHTRCKGAWCAYVDSVPGKNHDSEAWAVFDHGTKLPEHVARAIFGSMPKELPYAG